MRAFCNVSSDGSNGPLADIKSHSTLQLFCEREICSSSAIRPSSNTVGLGGFSNGEAQKSDFPYPHYNSSRLFLRQTFGFGGEQEQLGSGQLQLSGKQDISRLTFQIGKFAVLDVFDQEPLPPDSPYWTTRNLIVLPHISCDDPRYIDHLLDFWFSNFERFLAGKKLKNIVDRKLGY